MPIIEEAIVLDVPVDVALSEWNDFVYRRLIGHYSIGARAVEWKAVDDAEEAGNVWFEDVDGDHSRVVLRIDYDPSELEPGKPDPEGTMRAAMAEDLKKFKTFAEDAAKGDVSGADRAV